MNVDPYGFLMQDWASNTRLREERRFLQAEVFAGLKDLNTGFDSPLISHFSAIDFLEVINRCEPSHGADRRN
jgi:hypothetical protein